MGRVIETTSDEATRLCLVGLDDSTHPTDLLTETFMASIEKIGRSSPLGATVVDGGVNFCLFSRSATSVELLLFDREDEQHRRALIPGRFGDEPHLSLRHVSVRACERDSSTAIESQARPCRNEGLRFDATKFCSIRMVAASRFRRTIRARPLIKRATTPRRR